MHVVILGAGVVGIQIAEHLIAEGKDVVLIEKDPVRARYVSNHLDCIVLNEEGNSHLTLERAGIARADFFISVTNSDEVNLIACSIVASEFPGPIRIARVRNLEYSHSGVIDRGLLGVNHIVNSEVETARALFDVIQSGVMGTILTFDKTAMQIRQYHLGSDSSFLGKSIQDIRKTINAQFLIAGILREGNFIIPSGQTTIERDDAVFCMSNQQTFDRLFKYAEGGKTKKIQKMVLAGGGRIGTLLCESLQKTGLDITIIEENYEKCKILAEKFPDALVIHGDISDDEVFNDLRLNAYDLMVATTNNQEMNILSSAYARSLGTKRTVALVTKSNYLKISTNLGISATISPKFSTVDAILKYIRKGNIKSIHSLFDGAAEVIEFSISPDSKLSGTRIMDLGIPANALALAIIRDGQDHLPDGNTMIASGDTIIAIARKEAVASIEEIFSH